LSSSEKNLSVTEGSTVPSGKNRSFALVVAEWNSEITFALRDAAVMTLQKHEVPDHQIYVSYVPGSFELPLGCRRAIDRQDLDAVIALGCVIQGETPHFDFICQGVAYGITQLNIDTKVPVIFGVLTTLTAEQAKDRAGGRHGNKGVEAALTALKMANFPFE
jgi:6,7-dimethyl-8-ribityllumazine synthase